MAYTKQTWADLPSKTTPINAERLTHIEDGIFSAAQTADTAASTAGTAAANVGIVSGRVETLTGRVNDLDTAVSNKVDKVTGKGLSTNDYDDTDKSKVDSLGTASTKNSTSVVTQSTDLVESGAVYDALAEKADNSVIGTEEDGTNPTKSYAVGEHMIRGGKFCTVTVPVTTSSTWTLGSNYVEGDVASEFSAMDNKILPINKKDVTTSTPAEFTLENATVYILAVATGYISGSGKQYASLIFTASDGTVDEYKLAEQSLTVLTVDTSVKGKITISCTASTFKAALIKLVTR